MRLITLGEPALVIGDDGPPARLQPIPATLLAYLSVRGSQSRRHLAELFWPLSSNGLNTLSTTLSRIRRIEPSIVVSRGSTHLETTLSTDIAAMTGDPDASIGARYDTGFLGSVDIERFGIELQEWILEVRTVVAHRAESGLIAVAERCANERRIDQAAELASQAWRIAQRDATPSPEHFGAYVRCLEPAGNPIAADVRRLADDFGVDIEDVAPIVPDARPREVEPGRVGFGFDKERAALEAAIAGHSLVQIVGLGGSGKTFLARDLFDRFADPATPNKTWVELGPVDDPELVVATIASECGVASTPGQRLGDALASLGPSLLVLDNFEHLIDQAPQVTALATELPQLKVLVTSRIPLPGASNAAVTIRPDGLSVDRESPAALQLLGAAADRAGTDLRAADPDALEEVCRLVGGLPLALELAGSWTRVLPIQDVAAALRRSADLLEPAMGDASTRSMRTIVVESLASLDAEEHASLLRLAMFPAGISLDDTTTRLGLSTAVIANLADRSLLTVDRDARRMSLHPLIAQGALAELASEAEADARQAQIDWLVALVPARSPGGAMADARVAGVLAPELANILAVWRHASAEDRWQVIGHTLDAMREFFVGTGRLVQGQKAINEIVDAARRSAPPGLLVRIVECGAWLALVAGQPRVARSLVAEAERLLETCEDAGPDARVLVLRTSGAIDLASGDTATASRLFRDALELTTPDTPRDLVAKLQEELGTCLEAGGELDAAHDMYRAALDLGRELANPAMVARAYLHLAGLEQERNPRRCLVLLKEGLAVAEQHELDLLATYAPLLAGQSHLALEDPAAAEAEFERALDAATTVGQAMSVAAARIGLADSLAEVDITRAESELISGVRGAVETQCVPYLVWACFVAATITLRVDSQSDPAAGLLGIAAHHPAGAAWIRRRAEQALEEYGVTLEADHRGLGEAVSADEIGEQLLELLLFD